MGLSNVLFGRHKLKKAAGDKIFALSSARVTLEVELGLRPAGVAAVLFKPMSAAAELFMTHPPLEKRLAALAKVAREMGRPV